MKNILFQALRLGTNQARCWAAVLLTLSCAGVAAQGVLVGRVTRIHDGDTLTLQQHEHSMVVRLASIDAPELAQRFGRESAELLRACSFGRIVVVETRGSDRHGRTLGTLEAGGIDCGLQLLQAGLAWHYRQFADEQSFAQRQRYAAAEQAARRQRAGLWSQSDPTPPWTFRRSNPRLAAGIPR